MIKYFKNFTNLNICDAYILCWFALLLFESRIGLPMEGEMASLLIKILLIWSFYYFVKVWNFSTSIPYIRGLHCLTILYIVYGMESVFAGRTIIVEESALSSFTFLSATLRCVLPIYAFYYFNTIGKFSKDKLDFWFPLFILFAIAQYQINKNALIATFDRDDLTNNAAYIVLNILPLVAFIKGGQILKYLYLFFLTFLIFLSLKRGAILICLISTVVYILLTIRKSSNRVKLMAFIGSIVTCYVLYKMFNDFVSQNEYFASRLEDTFSGNSSGRDYLYGKLIDNLSNRGFIPTIIGTGAYTTVYVIGVYAHNDWLELATCMGLIGVFCYCYYWIMSLKQYKMMTIDFRIKMAFLLIMITYFARTFFSMSFNDIHPISACLIGYCISNNNSTRITL